MTGSRVGIATGNGAFQAPTRQDTHRQMGDHPTVPGSSATLGGMHRITSHMNGIRDHIHSISDHIDPIPGAIVSLPAGIACGISGNPPSFSEVIPCSGLIPP